LPATEFRLARIGRGFHRQMMARKQRTAEAPTWIGRETSDNDVVGEGPVRGLITTLESRIVSPQPGDAVPLLAHWLYCLPYTPLADAGPDGHARRGGLAPPAAPPRRMWAGSDIRFHRPLRIGTTVTRRSRIGDVTEKEGRSGRLMFVRIDHEWSDDDGAVLDEAQTLVYRDPPVTDAPAPDPRPAPAEHQWQHRIVPDPVLLFRYSALTFNSHRIHYDRRHAMEAEGYAGLVVHGPLIATLLLHALIAEHPSADVASFSFRAVRPIFDVAPFFIAGSLDGAGSAALFASDESGALCVSANAVLR
jgi:3-methylfumaryl-CoA hydratase